MHGLRLQLVASILIGIVVITLVPSTYARINSTDLSITKELHHSQTNIWNENINAVQESDVVRIRTTVTNNRSTAVDSLKIVEVLPPTLKLVTGEAVRVEPRIRPGQSITHEFSIAYNVDNYVYDDLCNTLLTNLIDEREDSIVDTFESTICFGEATKEEGSVLGTSVVQTPETGIMKNYPIQSILILTGIGLVLLSISLHMEEKLLSRTNSN